MKATDIPTLQPGETLLRAVPGHSQRQRVIYIRPVADVAGKIHVECADGHDRIVHISHCTRPEVKP